VHRRNNRDPLSFYDEKQRVRKPAQQRTTGCSSNVWKPQRLFLNGRQTTRNLNNKTLTGTSLLHLVPGEGRSNVRLGFAPDYQAHVTPA
jgi:hypothetical protein